MTDILESAKEQLHNNNFSIVIVGENDVYTSTKHGVAPLLEILDGGNDVIKNSFVADKVVGKAAALLMVKGGVKEVYADIISSHALDVFEKYKVKTYYGNLVEYIINRDKTGMCPMEKAVLEVDEPNTAYDVLTGCATRYLGSSLPSYSFIHSDFDGMPRQLQKLGYETLSIHPGYAWFYNRQNVYPDLGFAASYFLEDSFDLATQGYGGYVNETATMDKIIETLDTHIKETDTPLFSFTVTIQNHGPYEKKYGTLEQNFSSDIDLNETQTDLLTQ